MDTFGIKINTQLEDNLQQAVHLLLRDKHKSSQKTRMQVMFREYLLQHKSPGFPMGHQDYRKQLDSNKIKEHMTRYVLTVYDLSTSVNFA